jgi:hypothetical protein
MLQSQSQHQSQSQSLSELVADVGWQGSVEAVEARVKVARDWLAWMQGQRQRQRESKVEDAAVASNIPPLVELSPLPGLDTLLPGCIKDNDDDYDDYVDYDDVPVVDDTGKYSNNEDTTALPVAAGTAALTAAATVSTPASAATGANINAPTPASVPSAHTITLGITTCKRLGHFLDTVEALEAALGPLPNEIIGEVRSDSITSVK